MRNFLIELKWGVGFFLSGLLWVSLEKSLGWHDRLLEQHATYTLFYAPIAILIYVLALRDKRKNSYLGTMNYVQGFVSGLVVTLIVVLLTPVSPKPAEVRMGSGKGSTEYWACRVKPGRIMFELGGVPAELAKEAFELAAAKLPIKTKFIARFGSEE